MHRIDGSFCGLDNGRQIAGRVGLIMRNGFFFLFLSFFSLSSFLFASISLSVLAFAYLRLIKF